MNFGKAVSLKYGYFSLVLPTYQGTISDIKGQNLSVLHFHIFRYFHDFYFIYCYRHYHYFLPSLVPRLYIF